MAPAAQSRAQATELARAARDMRPHARQAAELLKALANEQRLMILCHLVQGPLWVSELNQRVPLSQSALSQHLAVLRDAGIVNTQRDAQNVRYCLKPGVVTQLLRVLHEEFCGR
ncbi:MAG TPA: metalloregulator ArsR/SmtB family transcription factor [Steroidobacteraceae bacterium]|nr:metalloregulator ArsR/SmtB family transcription factor [Steroidobacteraceae bacterium]